MLALPFIRNAVVAVLLTTAAAKPPILAQSPLNPARTPVLVELFTSEGCSSCPPADALLARLLKTQPVPAANILVLEEHVDYWDSLGWHDRFSSHQFTDRQTQYAQRLAVSDPYTPQMIVDGASQFVGNDAAHALNAVAQAARNPKLPLKLSPLIVDNGRINCSVVAVPSASLPKADLYAALIETTATTSVLRGENGGHTLHHVSVVRALQKIGNSDKLTTPISFSLNIPKDAVQPNLRVIVFAQRSNQGPVVGIAQSDPPAPPY